MTGLVTLLTDFGWDDPYLAELKAALYEQWRRFPAGQDCPGVVDLCHTIGACDIAAAAWFLQRVHESFPPGTVHLAVVDPGVGTDRPVVAVQARERFYVGPGNGLFACLVGAPDLTVVRLDNPLYQRRRGQRGPAPTFQGRDIMAPAAAHLAVGVPLQQVGSLASSEVIGDLAAVPPVDPPGLGRVVWIDRFGNAISDIRRDDRTGQDLVRGARLQVGSQVVAGPYQTFGTAPTGEPFWYWGSNDCLELGLTGESAATRYGWRRGLAIHLVDP